MLVPRHMWPTKQVNEAIQGKAVSGGEWNVGHMVRLFEEMFFTPLLTPTHNECKSRHENKRYLPSLVMSSWSQLRAHAYWYHRTWKQFRDSEKPGFNICFNVCAMCSWTSCWTKDSIPSYILKCVYNILTFVVKRI